MDSLNSAWRISYAAVSGHRRGHRPRTGRRSGVSSRLRSGGTAVALRSPIPRPTPGSPSARGSPRWAVGPSEPLLDLVHEGGEERDHVLVGPPQAGGQTLGHAARHSQARVRVAIPEGQEAFAADDQELAVRLRDDGGGTDVT